MKKNSLKKIVISVFLLAFLSSAVLMVNAASVVPELYQGRGRAGNPSCADLGYAYELKFEDGGLVPGTYEIGEGYEVTWSLDGSTVDWESTLWIDAVIMKGGPVANVYFYPDGSMGDEGLVTPDNTNGRGKSRPYGLSHVTFCFDDPVVYVLEVEKTAETEYTRTYLWGIEKTSDVDELMLEIGESVDVDYEVTVTLEGYEDSGFTVSGTITITNPADSTRNAYIASITDLIDGEHEVDVVCDPELTENFVLVPGESLACEYSIELEDATSETAGINEVVVATTGRVLGSSDEAGFGFAEAEVEYLDTSVQVDDDWFGSLGMLDVSEALDIFEYRLQVGPYSYAGEFDFVNTATLKTSDTETELSDGHTIFIAIEEETGVELECDWVFVGNETAWSDGARYINPGNWATYTSYGGEEKTVTLYAGQTIDVGTVHFSAPSAENGLVTITITLNEEEDGFVWRFHDVAENVKIQDYQAAPSGNPAPGLFDHKATATESPFSIEVPQNLFYGVHVDVAKYEWVCEEAEEPVCEWAWLEQVDVPSDGSTVYSENTLNLGEEYKLIASGTYTYNNAGDWADAEWYLKNGEIVKGDTEGSQPHVLDVTVSDDENTDWGDFSEDHIYDLMYIGKGEPVSFYIYDSFYPDNSGSIQVDIYECIYN